jgi:tape measure domain-containing protein
MAETNEFYIKIGADVDEAMSKLGALSSKLSSLASNTQRSGSQISSSMTSTSNVISAAFSSMGVALTTVGIVGGIIGIGKAALQTAAELEQISVSFEVFTGNAEVAKNMLGELKAQALSSPMQFQDIAKGAQTLMQYGINAEQVVPITKMLGDISSGNADKFSRLSLAFGQVNAAGRLMGQEARQMINAGFNPLQAISDKTGQSMAVLTQRMHDGQISVREVAQAFIYATSEGGRYFGMAEKQSQTLSGAFNKMSESISFTLATIGENLNKTFDIGGITERISFLAGRLAQNFESTNESLQKTSFWSNVLKNGFDVLAISIDLIIKTVMLLGTVLEKVFDSKYFNNFSNNLDTIAIKIAGLFGKTAQDNFKSLLDYVNNFGKSTFSIQKQMENSLTKKITDWEKFLKTFSKDPSKIGKDASRKKKEGVEVIPGTDFITNAEGERIKKLIQMEKDASKEIFAVGLSANQKKLAELKLANTKLLAEMKKAGVDSTAIEFKNLSEISLLAQQIEAEKNSAIMKLIKPVSTFENYKLQNPISKITEGWDQSVINNQIDSFQNLGKSYYDAAKGLSENIAGGLGEIAGSIMLGELTVGDAFKSLGALILNMLGDYLIKVGGAAITFGVVNTVLKNALTAGFASPESAIVAGIAAVSVGTALKGLAGKVTSSMDKNKSADGKAIASGGAGASSRISGSTYQYGNMSNVQQSVRLFVDLTGSITQSATGYSINKSMETTLRITGR